MTPRRGLRAFLSRDPVHMYLGIMYGSTSQLTQFLLQCRGAGEILMNSDKARERAEKSFRKEERAQDGRKAMIEYESQARATREKTARLKELRLAREAEARSIIVL
jgi:hypothetical protein